MLDTFVMKHHASPWSQEDNCGHFMNSEGWNIVFLQLYVFYINHFEMYFVLDSSPHVQLELRTSFGVCYYSCRKEYCFMTLNTFMYVTEIPHVYSFCFSNLFIHWILFSYLIFNSRILSIMIIVLFLEQPQTHVVSPFIFPALMLFCPNIWLPRNKTRHM